MLSLPHPQVRVSAVAEMACPAGAPVECIPLRVKKDILQLSARHGSDHVAKRGSSLRNSR
jgi:hypothetical protein